MTTVLEIIDTALKVGLGAAISAGATYLVSARNQRFEVRRAIVSEKTELIRSAALKLEQSSSLLNQNVHAIFHVKLRDSDAATKIVGLLPEFTTSFNLVKEARALCYLAGQRQLGVLLATYGKEQDAVHRHYATNGVDFDTNLVTAKLEELTKLKTCILEEMGDSLERIHNA